jgi:transcriptional regulator with XRE-family HTH domain
MGKSVLSSELDYERAGRILAVLRKYAGWTQDEVAARAGISVDTVSKRETGGTEGQWLNPIRHLAVLAQATPQGFEEVFAMIFGEEEAEDLRRWLETARYMWERRDDDGMQFAREAAESAVQMHRRIESLEGKRARP